MQSKKLRIMSILNILRKYSDEDHRLNQKDIIKLYQQEYGEKVDRKAVKRNMSDLLEFGFDIEYSESIRKRINKDGKEEEDTVLSEFYLNRDFTESELRLLIDSILFSMNLPHKQKMGLIEKLEGLSSVYFKSKVKHIKTLTSGKTTGDQIFYTIEVLDDAIEDGKQVRFHYSEYGTDKKLHRKKNSAGEVRSYLINPYQIVAVNGRYYLLCNNDKYDTLSHYRLDKITDIELLDTPVKSKELVQGFENGRLNLLKYMGEHLYMFMGESTPIKFRFDKQIIGEVIDRFGDDIRFSDETDTEATATVKVGEKAMKMWAQQFMQFVTVLSPQSLVDDIKSEIEKALQRY